ncbi:uncharacterized protein LOC123563229 isoform X1 [Mercenaria mercenaria]|uniref:uncharacterized protein LOC123563229 isoform X1 n=1 Tax=Mercenaria mercenaria TaxID=6596 RepID=UPI00234ECD1E|nr:uncharacterized protein LOC123563229 isoform X1 [Mercenaria mercenaria]
MTEACPVNTQQSARQGRRPGLCFACGKPGHWRGAPECPERNTNNKISNVLCTCIKKEKSCNCSVEKSFSKSQGNVLHLPENADEHTEIKQSETEEAQQRVVSPVGRLRHCSNKWREASDSAYIMDVVEKGYKLPLKEIPPSVVLKNNKSARDNTRFVEEELSCLLDKKVVSKSSVVPHVVNPLTVAYSKTGKPRLVLDCRHINRYLHKFRVKFEDIKVAEKMFDENSFLFTFDLKGAYHHIDIFPEHRTYLGFSWLSEGDTHFYVFNSLPFGINTAGHIFTKMLRVVVSFLRSKSHRIIMFLDDGIGGHVEYVLAERSSVYVRKTLCEFGFLLADEKCNWQPTSRVVWLGHVIDMSKNLLFITDSRIDNLEVSIDSVLYQIRMDKCNIINVKALASVVGKIISLQNVIGNKVRMRTREMYRCILSRASWNAPVLVSEQAIAELKFWRENVRKINHKGKYFKNMSVCAVSIYADASAEGYGGFIKKKDDCLGSQEYDSKKVSVTCMCKQFPERTEKTEHGFDKTLIPVTITERVRLPEVSINSDCVSEVCRNHGRVPEVTIYSDCISEVGRKSSSKLPEASFDSECLPEEGHEWFPEGGNIDKLLPEESKYLKGSPEANKNIVTVSKSVHKCFKNSNHNAPRHETSAYCANRFQKIEGNSSLKVKPPDTGFESQVNTRERSENDSEKNSFRTNGIISKGGKGTLPKVSKIKIAFPETESQVIGKWDTFEKVQSSTWRETEAVSRIIKSNAHVLKNKLVHIFTDNKNVKSILLNGSKTPSIQRTALDLANFCENENISFRPEWIPRVDNELADYLSRCTDCDDWEIHDSVFSRIDCLWGPHTIDRFASHLNNKCSRFNSRWWVPGTKGIDSLNEVWKNENNWLVPPTRLIVDCINKINSEHVECSLIIPKWKSAPFWPLLLNEDGNFKYFIKQTLNLSRSNVVVGNGYNGTFDNEPLKFDMIALKIIS